jgi:hypothetical protein
MDGEELQKLSIEVDLSIPGVFMDSVKEVGLFVIIWSENDIVDDALENLNMLVV